MGPNRRALADSVVAAGTGYLIAVGLEALLIRALRPTEWELAWVSDVALAVSLGVAVYLWRHLLTTRHQLAERDRAELVLQAQLSMAADIQRRLLPDVPPSDDGFEWAAALRSAGKIGGDFYDFIEVAPHMWVVLVADVSGKGVPAAMALGSVRSAFRTLALQGFAPAELVTRLSAAFLQQWRGVPYLTCIALAFDLRARTLTYCNAGHPAGIVAGPQGTRYLARGGPPAGLLPNAHFDQELLQLQIGDICLLVTDGVTEALEGDVPLERDLIVSRICATSAADLCSGVMTRALRGRGPFGDPEWDDDQTVVVVRLQEGPALARSTCDQFVTHHDMGNSRLVH
jgi:sigma-B regulation protein RsbU (phosphoserine phosphatase)